MIDCYSNAPYLYLIDKRYLTIKPSLAELQTFMSIVRTGSFRAASVELGVSPPAVSLSLKQLEDRLGLKLINRSTRSMSLTEAGAKLYEELAPALSNIDRAVKNIADLRDRPTGTLRIVASRLAARLYVAPLVRGFVDRYPEMKVELWADDNLTDLSEDNFDAGVRLGAIVDDRMVAIPIGPKARFVVVATSAYWRDHARPSHPRELLAHECVSFRFPTSRRPYQWMFRRGNEELSIEVKGSTIVNDMDVAATLVLKGVGVGYLLYDQVAEEIESGRLVTALEAWLPPRAGHYLYYPSNRLVSRGFQAFKEFVRETAC
ncbi:LysR family transcriptional regulator [Halomonas sp. MCCC 1A11036]|uniref:LysR family transcriptional regulator n=1 Tax=Billgrantia zhangzhouensis TaxID=2733481 RepID=A0ABS9AA43_9GAMM|nr:LysR family transcriptional regulator [Halomonas zhangzhouensis]MCE8018729.1 LysR family transcriptional regulator [Halomonas zhangzhouensis]